MVKTITIREDVYRKLLAIKSEESFSDLIERLVDERGLDILRKVRERTELEPEEKELMVRSIYSKRTEKRDLS